MVNEQDAWGNPPPTWGQDPNSFNEPSEEMDLERNRYGQLHAPVNRRGYYGADWWHTGPHRGKGPRNYHRSDERIHEDVNDYLTQNPDLDASDIEVRVENGEVTLNGSVDSRHSKRLAEDLADDVPGVVDVNNELKIVERPADWQTALWGSGDWEHGLRWKGVVHEGMDVLGSDGVKVGTVKQIRDYDILVNRPLARDIHVPFSAIDNVVPSGAIDKVAHEKVLLNIPADQVDKENWPQSEKEASGTA